MSDVPTLYLRDVPASLVRRLRARAERNRRSMNAEAVEILESALDEEFDAEKWIAEFRRLQYVIPDGAPTVRQAIRWGRDDQHDDDHA